MSKASGTTTFRQRLQTVGHLLVEAARSFPGHKGFVWAAAISYYSLLSLFPLLLAAVSIAALFVDPQWAIDRITGMLGPYLPHGENKIATVVQEAVRAGSGVSILSVFTVLWTGSRVFAMLTQALNAASDTNEVYSFWKRTLVEFGMMATLGLLFILAVSSPVLFGLLWNALDILPSGRGVLFALTVDVLPTLLLAGVLFLVYRFVPRRHIRPRAALAGALVSTLLFATVRPLFGFYVRNFTDYNLIYGSLALVAILMFWAWTAAVIILYGGEVAARYQKIYMTDKQGRTDRKKRNSLRHRPFA